MLPLFLPRKRSIRKAERRKKGRKTMASLAPETPCFRQTEMAKRGLFNNKGRSPNGSFVQLPHRLLNEPKFLGLSGNAVKLLLDLFSQFKGKNNGDFSIAWSRMKARGWRSKSTLHRAKDELIAAGMITTTRQGGLGFCSLYAVTWLAIDECGGKLDIEPTRVAQGTWRSAAPITKPL